jgi:hypothetical protein
MTTPADELRAAAKVLRGPDGTITVTIPAAAADALADWLDTEANRLGTTVHPRWQDTVAYRALAVARALNGDAR